MKIRQFEDKKTGRLSYAVVSKDETALIDPYEDPRIYFEFSGSHHATVTVIIMSHINEDLLALVSPILKQTGASLFASRHSAIHLPFFPFDEGEAIVLGHTSLKAVNILGVPTGNICIAAMDDTGTTRAFFTGRAFCDTSFPVVQNIFSPQGGINILEKLPVLKENILSMPAGTTIYGSGRFAGKGNISGEENNKCGLLHITKEEFIEMASIKN